MDVDRVAVIGAGPCGIGAAKYLIAERKFSNITIFEQRDVPGGLWNYTGDEGVTNTLEIPRPTPSQEPQQPSNGKFISPVYDSLETNIPKSLMQFTEFAFPEEKALFPAHADVKDYLHEYAEELRPFTRFRSTVLDVSLVNEPKKKWKVTWRNLESGLDENAFFDAVVVANGHYNDPYLPALPGLDEWKEKYPGSITHSSTYRRPGDFAGKKVIVVGNSASGIDIALQISKVSKGPVLISERTPSTLSPEQLKFAKDLPEIRLLDAENARVQFTNGLEEFDIDHILFCTGYHCSLPFLSSLQPAIVTDGVRPHHLYRHLLYTPEPTLALIGFPQRVVPFPLSQAQGAWVARVFSGRVTLPPRSEMEQWIEEWTAIRGSGKGFSTLSFPLDAEYINSLSELSSQAVLKEGLENDGRGKRPPFWDEKQKWVREQFPLIKSASLALGSRRSEVRTLEDLGFDYQNNKKQTANL
ncbi:hypothetical protein N7495_009619 [Penicillium taxi]|uniref:uncharacterized protein n=1 Tax=Penicillium taxi TaxID=168475 RepID=UPI00254525FE|nr:uncharacterized protein N7495_009619 [Penicillium taxi]KAJ5885109.1 hypothetical protein N7495_009619 [Penicillium taxi]